MLKSSRTWPSILTMAVVQLKFDQKGKYSYSTITDINQSHKPQIIENHVSRNHKRDVPCPHNGDHKNELITRKNVTSRPLVNRTQLCASSHNAKVCLCDLEFRDNRKRSESIKVDNWDYIYKEKSFGANLELPEDQRNGIPK